MTSDTNPQDAAYRRSQESLTHAFLLDAMVSSAPEDHDFGAPEVGVQHTGATVARDAPVLPEVHGDIYIPPENYPVYSLPGFKNDYNVVKSSIPNVDVPQIVPGERILSHPLSGSHIMFQEDGSILIRGDAGTNSQRQEIVWNADGTIDVRANTEVRINDGDTAAVTDVTIASTNSEGGATDLAVHRNDTVKLPSGNTTT
jgi:hypothetical protein